MVNIISPVLIRSVLTFVISLVVSIAVVSASYVYMDDVDQDRKKAQREMRKWQSKINSSVENNQIIEQYESNFMKLVNQGVVGTEDRLSWFETIQQTTRSRGMPSVKYAVSTQRKLDELNLKSDYSGIDVFKSVMSLDVKMAHEGDLFSLINNLKKTEGLFTIDKCTIEKISRLTNENENNMTSSCDIGWYTFKGSNAS